MDYIFRKQIEDDIDLIQKQYGYIDARLIKKEFAFNYWVLSRLYSLDEEIIPDNVTDINDKGIDCFVHYEDTKELFLIQNKYYAENTSVSREDVSDFLYTPLRILINGEYKRSAELQKIFNRISTDSEYKIYLHFYVTNDYESDDIDNLFEDFEFDHENLKASVYAKYNTLHDIRNIYYDDRFTEQVHFTALLPTRNAGTSLDVRPDDYGLDWMIDLRFVLVNVVDLYRIYVDAVDKNYCLFEENIREYLGTRGINNGIIKTLRNPIDRENFFYYNNGVTIICDNCKTKRGQLHRDSTRKNFYGFELENPQIVNGCQTVNSIAEVLSNCSEDRLETEFSKTFVLVKVFVFDEKTKVKHPNLDFHIVKYTNSQNGINEKAFASKKSYFLNIQTEFKSRGMLLLVKPSDKNIFSTYYSSIGKAAALNAKNKKIFEFFKINGSKLNDAMIPLEKLLKVLLAFKKDGYAAFHNGGTVLKPNSQLYKTFSLYIDEYLTIDNMLRIYMLYVKAEAEKKSTDKRFPIPYYLLSFMGQPMKGKTNEEINNKLDMLFSDERVFEDVYSFYKKLSKIYATEYIKDKNVDYNGMIKSEISDSIYEHSLEILKSVDYPENVKRYIEE